MKWGWKNDTPENVYIGDCIFGTGVHTWEIVVKSCVKCGLTSKFDVGVIGAEGNIVASSGKLSVAMSAVPSLICQKSK